MRRNWTETEVRMALALYLRLEFGKIHTGTAEVQDLASRTGRSPSAVALKLANLAALDDSLPRRGMANASALDRRIWQEFLQDPTQVVAAAEAPPVALAPPISGFAERQQAFQARQQSPAEQQMREARQGQGFFRDMILTSYQGRCALTGIEDPRLLTASHIVGWAEDRTQRMNPCNGLCLNALHDRAFDRHLITFDSGNRMLIAPDLPREARSRLTAGMSGELTLPARFLPDPALMARHRGRFHARTA